MTRIFGRRSRGEFGRELVTFWLDGAYHFLERGPDGLFHEHRTPQRDQALVLGANDRHTYVDAARGEVQHLAQAVVAMANLGALRCGCGEWGHSDLCPISQAKMLLGKEGVE